MDYNLINGMPGHPLFVHGAVVLVPLTALALVACSAWPNLARRLGWLLPALAAVTLAMVVLAVESGEWLEERVKESALVNEHAGMGEDLTPWTVGLLVVAAALWWLGRSRGRAAGPAALGGTAAGGRRPALLDRLPIRIAALVVSLVVAGGAAAEAYWIGDSGAKAVWHGNFSPQGGEGGGAGR